MMAEIFLPRNNKKKADKIKFIRLFFFYIERFPFILIALTIYCIPIAITMNPTILEIAI
jgi:hypothetical protein